MLSSSHFSSFYCSDSSIFCSLSSQRAFDWSQPHSIENLRNLMSHEQSMIVLFRLQNIEELFLIIGKGRMSLFLAESIWNLCLIRSCLWLGTTKIDGEGCPWSNWSYFLLLRRICKVGWFGRECRRIVHCWSLSSIKDRGIFIACLNRTSITLGSVCTIAQTKDKVVLLIDGFPQGHKRSYLFLVLRPQLLPRYQSNIENRSRLLLSTLSLPLSRNWSINLTRHPQFLSIIRPRRPISNRFILTPRSQIPFCLPQRKR